MASFEKEYNRLMFQIGAASGEISHREWARLCGLNQSTISRIVSGTTVNPHIHTVLRMALAVGVKLDTHYMSRLKNSVA